MLRDWFGLECLTVELGWGRRQGRDGGDERRYTGEEEDV